MDEVKPVPTTLIVSGSLVTPSPRLVCAHSPGKTPTSSGLFVFTAVFTSVTSANGMM